eukprot:RCo047312
MKRRNTLRGPTVCRVKGHPLEYSVHLCPRSLGRELQAIFPSTVDLRSLLIVVTFQPTSCPLVTFTEETERQKNEKVEIFEQWAGAVVQRLAREGQWADYTDPVSGFPKLSARGAHAFSDVYAMEHLVTYELEQICAAGGGCRVVVHPKWKLGCYPATAFTTAPPDRLLSVLDELFPDSVSTVLQDSGS